MSGLLLSQVTMATHHLVTFHEYYQAHSEIPSKYTRPCTVLSYPDVLLQTRHAPHHCRPAVGACRYYAQNMALNECVFRHRQMYDFIAVIDRDEFIYVADIAPKDVDLPAMLHTLIDGTPFASVGMFAARYGRASSLTPCICHIMQCFHIILCLGVLSTL